MKTCEICGRTIKTGRKYCWEHRHTAQANKIRDDDAGLLGIMGLLGLLGIIGLFLYYLLKFISSFISKHSLFFYISGALGLIGYIGYIILRDVNKKIKERENQIYISEGVNQTVITQ